MKTITFFLILFAFATTISGQNNLFPDHKFIYKPYDYKLFNDSSLKRLNYNFQNKFGNEYFQRNNHLFPSGKYFSGTFDLKKSPQRRYDNLNFNSTMPIYNPEGFSNMPIFKPDSAIHYHILIKKIDMKKSAATWLP